MYRNSLVIARGDTVIVMGVEGGKSSVDVSTAPASIITGSIGSGVGTFKMRYAAQIPGIAVAFSPFNQVLMAAVQSGHRGSLFTALTADQAIDSYGILGSFHIQSLATWGGSLIYGGYRQGQEAQIYTYPETLADRLPTIPGVPYDVLAMLPTPEYALMSFNNVKGLWWMDDKGSGPFCQAMSQDDAIEADPYQITRSAVLFDGSVYYSVDSDGVYKVTPTPRVDSGTSQTGEFALSGYITSGWFDGGFPELWKHLADIEVRLDSPLLTGQAVTLSIRRDDLPEAEIGGVDEGASVATLPVGEPFKRLDIKIAITSPNAGNGYAVTTPVVTSVIARYIPVPTQRRVWGFTVRAEHGLTLLDGSREPRTPAQIIEDLFAARSPTSVLFSSVYEPLERMVYVNDLTFKGQLLGKAPGPLGSLGEEGFIAVEVLEV